MEYKVTGCKDCPLYNDGKSYEFAHYCNHPSSPQDVSMFTAEPPIKTERHQEKFKEKDGYDYYAAVPITPDWCPLNKETITINRQEYFNRTQ